MDYKHINEEFIFDYCQANGEMAWLAEITGKKTPCKIYPRLTDANGEVIYFTKEKNGKEVKYTKPDKSKEPKIELRPISFISVKNAFCEKFMPDLLPTAKAKKLTIHERAKMALEG